MQHIWVDFHIERQRARLTDKEQEANAQMALYNFMATNPQGVGLFGSSQPSDIQSEDEDVESIDMDRIQKFNRLVSRLLEARNAGTIPIDFERID